MGRETEDGVERTHREARSHDLMNELAWLLAPWWGTRAAFTLPRRLSVPEPERDGTGHTAPSRAGERIDSNSNVGYMHDVAGLKNPGSTRIERGIALPVTAEKKEGSWTKREISIRLLDKK